MRHKDLLHTVNNQLEIITSAAELVSLRDADPITQDLCSKIHAAVLDASTALSAHVKALISEAEVEQSSSPAPPKRRALST
jgi:hypothetical protein